MGLPAVLDNAGRAGVELPRQAGARGGRGGVPSGAGFPERAFGCRIFRAWASRRGLPGVGLPPAQGVRVRGFLGAGFPGAGFPGAELPGTEFSGRGLLRRGASGNGASPSAGRPRAGLLGCRFPRHGISGRGASRRGLHGAGFPGAGFPGTEFPGQASRCVTLQRRLLLRGLPGMGFTAQAPRRSPAPRCGASQRSPAPRQTFLPAGAGALANRSFPNSPPCAGATKRRRVFGRSGESDFGVPA